MRVVIFWIMCHLSRGHEKKGALKNFPTEDCAFKEDFSVLTAFVPTDTLDHLKEYGKATKKSTPGEVVAEMSSTKGLRLLLLLIIIIIIIGFI